MIGEFQLDIFITDLAFNLNSKETYVSTDIERGIVEYFLLQELLLLIFIHIPFQEMERSIGLFDLNWLTLSLLLLEDGAQVSIFAVVLTSLHR
jgi:hypothetical protein